MTSSNNTPSTLGNVSPVSRAGDMAAYDLFPPAWRRILRELPFDYGALSILATLRANPGQGAAMARQLAASAEAEVRRVTLESYGQAQPDAAPCASAHTTKPKRAHQYSLNPWTHRSPRCPRSR